MTTTARTTMSRVRDVLRIVRDLSVIAAGVPLFPLIWLAFRWQHRNRKRKA